MADSLWNGWEQVELLRPDDFLVAVARWRGLDLDRAAGTLTAQDGGGHLVLDLAPQHVEELAWPLPSKGVQGSDPFPKPGPALAEPGTIVDGVLAARSRLAFLVPAGTTIPFTAEGLLAATATLALSVDHRALPDQGDRGRVVIGLGDHVRGWLAELATGVWRLPPEGAERLADFLGAAREPGGEQDLTRMVQRARTHSARSALHPAPSLLDRLARWREPFRADRIEIVVDHLRRFSAPAATETAIEVPARLVLSPHAGAGFASEARAVPRGAAERVELWHARLGRRLTVGGTSHADDGDASGRTLRAIWSRGGGGGALGDASGPAPPFKQPIRAPVTQRDRWELVRLTSDAKRGRPVAARRLMVSSLGTWMEVQGRFKPWQDEGVTLLLEEWRHRTTWGRDQYVRVVYRGFLFPWGHRASYIVVSEREMTDRARALLRQRYFVAIRQPVKQHDCGPAQDAAGRFYDKLLPFDAIEVRTKITPELATPAGKAFWIDRQDTGERFAFDMAAHPFGAADLPFTAPSIFVLADVAIDPVQMAAVAGLWNAAKVQLDLGGRSIAFAPEAKPGSASHPVHAMRIDASVPGATAHSALKQRADGREHPYVVATMGAARVSVPALERFGEREPAEVAWADGPYAKRAGDGFGAGNEAGVYLQLTTPRTFDLAGPDRAGALVRPVFGVSGLSRELGPVGGKLDTIAAGTFNPADFLGAFAGKAKLFGAVNLLDIIDVGALTNGLEVPRFVSEAAESAARLNDLLTRVRDLAGGAVATRAQAALTALTALDLPGLTAALQGLAAEVDTALAAKPVAAVEAALNDARALLGDAVVVAERALALPGVGEELTVKVAWSPKLKAKPPFLAWEPGAELLVQVEAQAKSQLQPDPRVDVLARVRGAKLTLVGSEPFMTLVVEQIEFRAVSGRKPEIDVRMGDLRFTGVLAFVETLRQLIPLDGFSDPPALEVDETGVRASFSLSIPTIAFGVFALKDLSLGAGFRVPWVGEAMVASFNFCTRERPFLLTVMCFGGGGYLLVEAAASSDGTGMALEAGFVFGASLCMDFGVASGEVHVLGGFTFALKDGDGSLTGYLRIGGSVEALGIVTVSIELTLSLKYDFGQKKCVGRATLEIEIEIAFFSVSIEIECERKFAGSDGDPPFREQVDEDAWARYLAAFDPQEA